jgi:hypothetical protein
MQHNLLSALGQTHFIEGPTYSGARIIFCTWLHALCCKTAAQAKQACLGCITGDNKCVCVCRRHQARAKGTSPQRSQNPEPTGNALGSAYQPTSCSLKLQLRTECRDTATQTHTCTRQLLKAACAVSSGLTRVCKPDALSFGVEQRVGPHTQARHKCRGTGTHREGSMRQGTPAGRTAG